MTQSNYRIKYLYAGGIACLFYSLSSAVTIIAGWDGAMTTTKSTRSADIKAAGIKAELVLSSVNGESTAGSGDLTFGTIAGATANDGKVSHGAYLAKTANVYMDYTIKNNGSDNFLLETFHFDVWRRFKISGTPSVRVLDGGGVTSGELPITSLVPVLGLTPSAADANYSDADIPLGNLPDHTLVQGESVTFRIPLTEPKVLFLLTMSPSLGFRRSEFFLEPALLQKVCKELKAGKERGKGEENGTSIS